MQNKRRTTHLSSDI